MFAGAQVSLYRMTVWFVVVITSSLIALDPWRDRLRIEADDISRQCQKNFLAGGFRANGLVTLTFRSLNLVGQPELKAVIGTSKSSTRATDTNYWHAAGSC